MLESTLAPYLLWAKTRQPAAIDLAASDLLRCRLDDLPGAREALDLSAPDRDGYPPLVEAIARQAGVSTDRVVTAPGCSGACFLAIAALVGPNDDVLIEQPTYDTLIGACRLIGANVRRFARRFERGYAFDPDEVRERLTPRTRLIIVSSPHNPSGLTLDAGAIATLGGLADRVGAHVLIDEVYLDVANRIAGDGARTTPAARLEGPLVSTSSLTKSYGLGGLRCGWAIASPAIIRRLRRTRDLIDNVGSAPSDRLSALAFASIDRLGERARALLDANVTLARQCLAAHPELAVAGPPAASVMFPRLTVVEDAEPFVTRLFEQHHVAVAPGRFFDAPAHFRISLGGATAALEQGLAALGQTLDEMRTA